MVLYSSDVEAASPRDKQDDVNLWIEKLALEHEWAHLGEQGKRIKSALAQCDASKEKEAFTAGMNTCKIACLSLLRLRSLSIMFMDRCAAEIK